MRRSSCIRLLLLSGGIPAIFAASCGHSVVAPSAGNAGGAVSGTGGSSTSVGGTTSTGDPSNCSAATMPPDPTRPGYGKERDPGVAALLKSMTLENKIKQLVGIPNPSSRDSAVYRDIERSEDADGGNGKTVRGYRYRDAGRGVNLVAGQHDRASQGKDYSTAFPAPSIRAASWDVELEMQVGEAMGDETMVSKNNMLLAPCMNIIRHPYWGRTQETYGEDMYHIGRMASAYTAGLQKRVVACAKHYAANNIENGRSTQNAEMDEQTLREVYSQHFDMVVREGGIGCIMAAYNSINGKKSTQNKHLLKDILKGPVDKGGMGYRGLVITDWWAMPGDQTAPDTATAQANAKEALQAGLDLEVPWALNYSQLSGLVNSNQITLAEIDESVGRILEQKFRFGTVYTDQPYGLGTPVTTLSGDSITNNDAHLALAEEAEIRSAVLLSNGTSGAPVLPIKNPASIAVVGMDLQVNVSSSTELPVSGDILRMATDVNVGDRGSSRINNDPAKSVGPFAGIKAAAESHGISNVTSGNSVAAAQTADFVVVVVGLTAGDEGEEYSLDSGGDRKSLALPQGQEQFVADVLALDKPTVIIIESGSIVNLPWLSHTNQKQATVWAGYSAQRGGAAYGKLLFGDRNFSGKMPLAWPKEADLPPFRSAGTTTQMGYFFGYREFDRRAAQGTPVSLVYPFGHGLSYTTFEYSNLKLPCTTVSKTGVVNVTVTVKNTGAVDGDEVIMLFVAGPPKPATIKGHRPVKELKQFARVSLKAAGKEGAEAQVTMPLNIKDLRHWEGDANGSWVVDEGDYTIMVGPNGSDAALTQRATIRIQG